jgi:uncharacterized protein (DUF1697 family)
VTRYAAFLRGVNLGPRRKASSAQLCDAFERMGFENVATFRTSGNVAFDAGRSGRAKLVARVEQGLADALGFEVTVFLRTAIELHAVASHQPFPPKAVVASNGKLQVSLLPRRPSASVRKRVLALATPEDRLAFGATELYWLPSGGVADSNLDLNAIEKLVGPTTQRTKNTLELMAARLFAG